MGMFRAGPTIRFGDGVPNNGLGSDGDFYFETSGDVVAALYNRSNGTYSLTGNIASGGGGGGEWGTITGTLTTQSDLVAYVAVAVASAEAASDPVGSAAAVSAIKIDKFAVADITATGTSAIATIERVDSTSGNITRTLPTTPADKSLISIKWTAGTNSVTIACGGSSHFDTTSGGTSSTFTIASQAKLMQYHSADDTWIIIGDDLPLTQLTAYYDNRYSQSGISLGKMLAFLN